MSGATLTTFGMNASRSGVELPPLLIPARATLLAFAVVCAVAGGYQLARGFKKATNWMLALVVGLLVLGFLIWAAAGKSLNFTGLLSTALIKSVPLTLGALSGILAERARIVNIAIEGMMLSGAFISTLIASITGSLWLGLLAALIVSGMMAGVGGAYFTLGSVGRFDEVMTAGRGFISLAAMIFGNWMPFGSFGAGLLFGFANSLSSRLAILGLPIPPEFLGMAPYIVTMIILAGVIGRGQAPAAEGIAYEKE